MHKNKYASLASFFLAAAFFLSTITVGCAARGSYRVYDPEYRDYHRWNNNEVVYYQRWEVDTHRRHEDFRRRNREEQNEYWTWRHHHEGGGDQH
ncbi:MAG: hypothetical protein ACRD33_10165 [Candidatus Acidiferrales bacterium]